MSKMIVHRGRIYRGKLIRMNPYLALLDLRVNQARLGPRDLREYLESLANKANREYLGLAAQPNKSSEEPSSPVETT
jgi:hypothetical protein